MISVRQELITVVLCHVVEILLLCCFSGSCWPTRKKRISGNNAVFNSFYWSRYHSISCVFSLQLYSNDANYNWHGYTTQ